MIEKGKCVNCNKVLDREGLFCYSCANNLKLRARVRSTERRTNGLCVQCGEIAENGRSQCRRCLDLLKKRRKSKINQI